MAKYIDIHPENPQVRLLQQVVQVLTVGGVAAIPTDSGYALVCTMGNKDGLERIKQIRQVGDKHHYTLLCHNFAQLGKLVVLDNAHFRTIKALTPGAYTFILKATKEVPRITLHPKKATIGVRIPQHVFTQALVQEMGEPLISSSLILPGSEEALHYGWLVNDELGHLLDVVVEGVVGTEGVTTVVDFSSGEPELVRVGAGDTSLFTS